MRIPPLRLNTVLLASAPAALRLRLSVKRDRAVTVMSLTLKTLRNGAAHTMRRPFDGIGEIGVGLGIFD